MKSLACALLTLLFSLGISAEPTEFQTFYNKCIEQAKTINNWVAAECSESTSERAKSEITNQYKSLYSRLLKEAPEDATKLEVSQRAWIQYRNTQCELEGSYIGSPMRHYCHMSMNIGRAKELRTLAGESK